MRTGRAVGSEHLFIIGYRPLSKHEHDVVAEQIAVGEVFPPPVLTVF
jgi:hypothetical protein